MNIPLNSIIYKNQTIHMLHHSNKIPEYSKHFAYPQQNASAVEKHDI